MKHFTMGELCASTTADAHGIKNTPPLQEAGNLVGGKASSQHLKGEAADITAGSREENRKLFEYIRENLPFDQLIDEKNFSWVHVSYKRDGNNRKQILKL